MKLQVNGEAFVCEGRTLSELLQQMALSGRRLAVEVNQDIIPKSEHAVFQLSEGDVVEIVHAIGGG